MLFRSVDLQNRRQSESYVSGYSPIYIDDIKYPKDGNGPLKLVYMSSGFLRKDSGPINGVLIYEINKNYAPSTVSTTSTPPVKTSQPIQTKSATSKNPIATISTNFGDIVIELNTQVAPKTVDSFIKLANKKFYDDTLFHRIIDRKSTRLNSSHSQQSRMPSSA